MFLLSVAVRWFVSDRRNTEEFFFFFSVDQGGFHTGHVGCGLNPSVIVPNATGFRLEPLFFRIHLLSYIYTRFPNVSYHHGRCVVETNVIC